MTPSRKSASAWPWGELMEPTDGPPVLNEAEQEAMDALLMAYNAILDWGLQANTGELTSAVHVIQGFITQHMLERLAVRNWGQWYSLEAVSQRKIR